MIIGLISVGIDRMSAKLVGSCQCGRVAFELPDELFYAGFCHCSQCRKATGSSYSVFGGIEKEKVKLLRGAEHVARYEKSKETAKAFCKMCGTDLFGEKPQLGLVHIPYGILDTEPKQKSQVHLYGDAKASWDVINDGLPVYPQGLE